MPVQMTIAQIVYDNELHFGYSHDEIRQKVSSSWCSRLCPHRPLTDNEDLVGYG